MPDIHHRVVLAQQWRSVFGNEREVTEEDHDRLAAWLDDALPLDLAELLRTVYGAGRVARQ